MSTDRFKAFFSCSLSLSMCLWFRMWLLCCSYLLLICPAFGASGRLCFVIVVFPGYLHILSLNRQLYVWHLSVASSHLQGQGHEKALLPSVKETKMQATYLRQNFCVITKIHISKRKWPAVDKIRVQLCFVYRGRQAEMCISANITFAYLWKTIFKTRHALNVETTSRNSETSMRRCFKAKTLN